MQKIFFLMLTFLSFTAEAGIWETLSRASDAAFNKSCTAPLAPIPTLTPASEAPAVDCNSAPDALRETSQVAQILSEDTYLAALADERAQNDQCAFHMITSLGSTGDFNQFAEDMATKTELLAHLMIEQQRLLYQLGQTRGGRGAERRLHDGTAIDLRARLKKVYAAIAAVEHSMPLGEQSDIKAVIQKHLALQTEEAITVGALSGVIVPLKPFNDYTQFHQDLKQALKKAQKAVSSDITELQKGVASGGTTLDRATRESLAQDHELIEAFRARNPRAFQKLGPVYCSVDATYGRGAEKRDQALLVGSMAATAASLGSGLLARGGILAVRLALPARLAAARGLMSVNAARTIGAVSVALDTTTGLQQIDSACLQNQRRTRTTPGAGDRCENFKLESVEQDNCILNVGLAALGVGLSLPSFKKVAKAADAPAAPRTQPELFPESPSPASGAVKPSAATELAPASNAPAGSPGLSSRPPDPAPGLWKPAQPHAPLELEGVDPASAAKVNGRVSAADYANRFRYGRMRQAKTIDEIPWEEAAGDFLPGAARGGLRTRLSNVDPKIQKTMLGVHNRMNDPMAFETYMRKLIEDVAKETRLRNIPDEMAILEEGRFSRAAALRVLVKRSKERGDPRLQTIVGKEGPLRETRKPGNNPGFRAAVGDGPFFDKPFAKGRHGIDMHFLQRDFIADVVAQETGGKPQEFYNFLGSKQGISYWVPLFDADTGVASFASPEFLRHRVERYLPLR